MNRPGKLIFACYYINYLNLAALVVIRIGLLMARALPQHPSSSAGLFWLTLFIPSFVLWIYCIVFFYKNDKYSKSGLWLFLFSWIYSAYYFRNVIWKRKRELLNTINDEPVLENKIHIETEEDEN